MFDKHLRGTIVAAAALVLVLAACNAQQPQKEQAAISAINTSVPATYVLPKPGPTEWAVETEIAEYAAANPTETPLSAEAKVPPLLATQMAASPERVEFLITFVGEVGEPAYQRVKARIEQLEQQGDVVSYKGFNILIPIQSGDAV